MRRPPTPSFRTGLAVPLVVALAASVTALPGATAPAYGAEGVTMSLSVISGPTGTVIDVRGDGCLLDDEVTPGDGVVIQIHPGFGPSVAGTTVPVDADGGFAGSITVPEGTPAGTYQVGGECAYPQVDGLPTFRGPPFTVTGEGPSAAAAIASPMAQAQAAATQGTAIEPYPSYDGQSTCSPTAKRGTRSFSTKTLAAFPNTGTFGISRACNIGGTSEHKEGRAWDWKADATRTGQRRSVNRMVRWLLATDSKGRKHAMARRLGVMYIIWNRQMFRLYRAGDGWLPYGGSHPHTDHVHISFTRDGGAKRTSYWKLSSPPRWGGVTSGGGGTPPKPSGPTRARFKQTAATISGHYRPVAGDFDGNGRADIVWYGYRGRPDYVWFGRKSGGFEGRKLSIRQPYHPLVGDFDGDGRDDIFWYGRGHAPDRIWWGQRHRRFKARSVRVSGHYRPPFVGDFDGDGNDDIFWYGPGASRDHLWWGRDDRRFTGRSITITGRYRPPVSGDFDGDDRDDIFWYGPGALPDYLWWGRSNRTWTGGSKPVNGTYDPLVGDFNGDGEDDVFWYQAGSGWDGIWLGRTARSFTSQSLAVAGTYKPFVADFDGNGRDDVFWYGPGADRDFLWSF